MSESHYEDVGRRLFLLQISNDVTRKITSLPWHRDHAELLQETQGIPLEPGFDGLPSSKADDADTRHRHLLASRRESYRRNEITGVGATKCPARRHLVSFSDQVFNRNMEVGESAEALSDPPFVIFVGANVGGARIVIDEVEGV